MIFKKPYGFLIKHFRLIHLILTGLYIYLAIKVNSILNFYSAFYAGSASKLDAISYMDSYYIWVIVFSILICVIIYILMRYKKKPRFLYIILILFSLIVGFLINYSYQGLYTIYISVLNTKTLLLNRDLLRILSILQYIAIGFVLVRGLGFDIKKFNFVHDMQELGLNELDEEEVEVTLGGMNAYTRKFHRNFRELKYYYIENKTFINIIICVLIAVGVFSVIFQKEVINKVYNEGESFSTDKFQFQVVNTFITNRGFDNSQIRSDGTSFVIVRMNVGTTGEKVSLNTGNLILKIGNNSYSSNKKYGSRFTDLGMSYKGEKIGNMSTYLFIYNVEDSDLEKEMKLVYASDKTILLKPIYLDEESEFIELSLRDKLDFSKTSFGSGYFMVQSMDIQEKFSYPYQYEIEGQIYTNQMTISSSKNAIIQLVIDSSYPYGLDNYEFLEEYVTLKYKIGENEYQYQNFTNKTPGSYRDGLYLTISKDAINADEIWLEIKIRNYWYRYLLK